MSTTGGQFFVSPWSAPAAASQCDQPSEQFVPTSVWRTANSLRCQFLLKLDIPFLFVVHVLQRGSYESSQRSSGQP